MIKYWIEFINEDEKEGITDSSDLGGIESKLYEDKDIACAKAWEEAKKWENREWDKVLVNEAFFNDEDELANGTQEEVDEFETFYFSDGRVKLFMLDRHEMNQAIDDIVSDLERTYGLENGEDFFQWWRNEYVTETLSPFIPKPSKTKVVRLSEWEKALDKIEDYLEDQVKDAINGDYDEYYSAFGEVFGISSKDLNPVYVKRFTDMDEAEKWLNTEEYDFRARELLSEKEALKELNLSTREELDDAINFYKESEEKED